VTGVCVCFGVRPGALYAISCMVGVLPVIACILPPGALYPPLCLCKRTSRSVNNFDDITTHYFFRLFRLVVATLRVKLFVITSQCFCPVASHDIHMRNQATA